jgi:hypothetical protein
MLYVLCNMYSPTIIACHVKFKSCRVENIFGILAFNWVKPDYARPDQLE